MMIGEKEDLIRGRQSLTSDSNSLGSDRSFLLSRYVQNVDAVSNVDTGLEAHCQGAVRQYFRVVRLTYILRCSKRRHCLG